MDVVALDGPWGSWASGQPGGSSRRLWLSLAKGRRNGQSQVSPGTCDVGLPLLQTCGVAQVPPLLMQEGLLTWAVASMDL